MWTDKSYRRLETDSLSDEDIETRHLDRHNRTKLWQWLLLPIYAIAIVVFTYTISHHFSKSSRSTCTNTAWRREWRNLSPNEQQEYITAVNCLREQPSKIGLNQSLYDDFPWVHNRIGDNAHDSAAFLAWHRYFIHVYEQTLKDQCGFSGNLTYWDWTLDWKDVTKAPIWGPDTFGNTGAVGVGEGLLSGYCVTDGAFANLEVLYIKGDVNPHCLSRGFAPSEQLANLSTWIQPAAIEQLLDTDDYEAFNLGLEHAGHIAIPRSIRGDFLLLTAPYDPVFFLHHTQLDRLWSKWQGLTPRRKRRYQGASSRGSSRQASLTDKIDMGGLAPNVRVSDVIETSTGMLCYHY